MKGIILAAGRGSRMGDLTNEMPKCFTCLHGRRLIEWQMESLKKAGVNEIAIVVGYKKEAFDYDVRYFFNDDWMNSNMVMSLTKASCWLQDTTCIVSYSDIIYSSNAISKLKTISGDIGITYDKNWYKLWSARFTNPLSDAETFQIDKKGNLIEIGKNPRSERDIQGQFMGLLKLKPAGWKVVSRVIWEQEAKERQALDITSLLQKLIEKKVNVSTVAIEDSWYEVDSQSDLDYYASLPKLW